MRGLSTTWGILGILLLAVLGGGVFLYIYNTLILPPPEPTPAPPVVTEEPEESQPTHAVIGTSVEGRDIEAYTYGSGDTHLLLVGGIHGGYEWNSVLLAYNFMDYLERNPNTVPEHMAVTVIPSANPDGVFSVIGKEGRFSVSDVPADEGPLGNGRFNANGVDLNRNFDCKWEPESSWRGETVSAGSAPFSEPEAQALRDFVLANEPAAAVFFHSQANAVYASECHNGVLPETVAVMNTYADAAGYRAVESFDAYPITGDAEGWLATLGIPAITIELASHEVVEWEKNLSGVLALMNHYSTSDPDLAR